MKAIATSDMVLNHGCIFYVVVEEEFLIESRNGSNWEDKEGTDGRDSSSRPKTFFELGCNEFNDPCCRPASSACPDSHDDFLEPFDFFDDEER